MGFIDLSNCRLEDLGDLPVAAAQSLKLLRSLDLSNNDLRQIPPELGLVETLNALQLNGNQIVKHFIKLHFVHIESK